mmetsp:Transcript_24662/g.72130  ORF Transcript_24662/g.72130 Transcript_24662/m.72130 type:complete len:236 (-) Transcript_24662:450-1157(-)
MKERRRRRRKKAMMTTVMAMIRGGSAWSGPWWPPSRLCAECPCRRGLQLGETPGKMVRARKVAQTAAPLTNGRTTMDWRSSSSGPALSFTLCPWTLIDPPPLGWPAIAAATPQPQGPPPCCPTCRYCPQGTSPIVSISHPRSWIGWGGRYAPTAWSRAGPTYWEGSRPIGDRCRMLSKNCILRRSCWGGGSTASAARAPPPPLKRMEGVPRTKLGGHRRRRRQSAAASTSTPSRD